MSNRIVWQAPDGSLRVTIPADPQADLETVAAHAMQTDPTLAACTRLANVAAVDLPSRRFRNCWRQAAGKVSVDLPLARQQRLAEIRRERNAKLDATDKDAARLADIGTKQEQDVLKAKRQALRDLPAVVEADLAALTTADALALYSPTWPGDA